MRTLIGSGGWWGKEDSRMMLVLRPMIQTTPRPTKKIWLMTIGVKIMPQFLRCNHMRGLLLTSHSLMGSVWIRTSTTMCWRVMAHISSPKTFLTSSRSICTRTVFKPCREWLPKRSSKQKSASSTSSKSTWTPTGPWEKVLTSIKQKILSQRLLPITSTRILINMYESLPDSSPWQLFNYNNWLYITLKKRCCFVSEIL